MRVRSHEKQMMVVLKTNGLSSSRNQLPCQMMRLPLSAVHPLMPLKHVNISPSLGNSKISSNITEYIGFGCSTRNHEKGYNYRSQLLAARAALQRDPDPCTGADGGFIAG